MRFALLMILAGCGSSGGQNHSPLDLAAPRDLAEASGWTLTGTLAGFKLQDEAISGEAHAPSYVLVQLSSRAKICDLLQQNSCPNGRVLGFRIGSKSQGTFTVVDQDQPGASQAHIFLVDLDTQCLENAMVSATSGTLTVSASDLTVGGLYSFSFDADTPDGPVAGQVTVPFCQI